MYACSRVRVRMSELNDFDQEGNVAKVVEATSIEAYAACS